MALYSCFFNIKVIQKITIYYKSLFNVVSTVHFYLIQKITIVFAIKKPIIKL